MKIKNFCSVKDTLKEIKKIISGLGENIVKHISDKTLVSKKKRVLSKLYRENLKFHSKKTNNQI